VSSSGGTPIPNASVTLTNNVSRKRYAAVTDSNGAFAFPTVEPFDRYEWSAYCKGFAMPLPARDTMADLAPLSVAEGSRLSNVVFKLVPLGVISGRIVDEDGEPVRGVTIQAMQYAFPTGSRRLERKASATTNDRGQYRLLELKPGRYVIMAYLHTNPPAPPGPHTVSLIPAEGFPAVYYPGAADANQATPVMVGPAADLAGYDIHFTRVATHSVRGEVSEEASSRRREVMVAPCQGEAVDLNTAFSVRAEKTFEIDGLTSGLYCLAVPRNGGVLTGVDAKVQVGDRDVDHLTVPIPAPADVRGSVRLNASQETKLPSLRASLNNPFMPGLLVGSAPVRADGSFLLETIPAGSYGFRLNPMGTLYIESVKSGDHELTNGLLPVPTPGGDVSIVLGTDGGQVSGSVLDSEGKPGDHIVITLAPRGDRSGRPDLVRISSTGADATFQITNVAPGDYNVYAWEQDLGDALRSPIYLRTLQDRAVQVAVSAKGSASVQLKAINTKDAEEAVWKTQ